MAKKTQPRPKMNIVEPQESFGKRLGSRISEILDAAPVVLARALNRVLKFFLRGTAIERTIRDLLPIVDEINRLEATTVLLSDEELRFKTDEFRQRVAAGETLDDILPEAFAVGREAADRRNGMCNVLKPENGFDPARFEDEANRELYHDAAQRLEAGEAIWDIMFPASFYAEIRALYPDYRPPFRMRPFDVQLIGGIVLHQGKIAEMVTGEGKTLVAVLPAYLNTLGGGHVHVVTVNDYLARIGRDWNEPMFRSLGITIGAIQSDMDPSQRHPEYAADITYGTNNEFGFDYLRDNMKDDLEDQAQGPLQFAVIDEVDSILIDEARTPLIISGPAEESSERYHIANRMVKTLTGVNAQRLPRDELKREEVLQSYDYTFNLKDHSTALTEKGITSAQRFLEVDNIYHGRNMDWPPFIEGALKAKELYKLDVDYVIRDGEVIIVDEFTGRLMPGRRWSDGLHQAVEAKEAPRGARIKEENQTLATITFQNFFRLYDKISGMTGTALTEAGEFQKIYKLDVVPIPTNRPLRRAEYNDLIYGTEREKWGAIVEEIVSVHQTGRPILVGTISIEASENLSGMLERRGIEHEVLNAKHHEREAFIVKDAGQFGAVTVATNMAGRGTDIVLGQCTWQDVLAHLKKTGMAPRDITANTARDEVQLQLERYWHTYWDLGKGKNKDLPADDDVHRRLLAYWEERGIHPITLGESVAELGGLHIVATERHEARRIDNQLRGRAGRQGDPGSSRFFVSLEDDLMKIFMAQWVRTFMVRAGLSEGQPIESAMVSRAIERAQKKVEEQNFEVRKNLLEYDEVMDEQRKLIYDQRQEVLEGGERRNPADVIQRGIDRFIPDKVGDLPGRIFGLLDPLAATVHVDVSRDAWEQADRQTLETLLADKARQALKGGIDRKAIDAWVGQIVADARADGEAYPERWQLGRLARWARSMEIDVPEERLAALVHDRLADVLAQAAGAQQRDDLATVLRNWFVVGYEQDLPLLSRASRWELDTFRQWLRAVGVSVEIVEWTPARSTCEALTPLWLEAAEKTFAGRSPADVSAELTRAAAVSYLGSSLFRQRPDARRLAYWAERRLAVEVTPHALLQAYEEAIAPAFVQALADPLAARLKGLSATKAAEAWAAGTAAWHLDSHLRFHAHNLVGLATYLSARLRVGLSSLALAQHPRDAMAAHVLDQLEERAAPQDDGQHFEGLEDIAFNMVNGVIARLVENSLGDRYTSLPSERSFTPLAIWANELSLSIAEEQWLAFGLPELRLHFLREAADAYPAETAEALAETFIPRFTRTPVRQFLGSDGFREQPGYGMLAAWGVGRYAFLPRDSQVEAQVKRFAEDSLKKTRAQLIAAKLADFAQDRTELDFAVEDLVPPTLDAFRSTAEGDEVDLGGLAAFARKVFDVSVQVHKLEEEAQGDEREAVRALTAHAKRHYARHGMERLVADAVEGVFDLHMPADTFPSEWRCELMHHWLRVTGLSGVLSAEELRDETLMAIEAYFERSAVDALRDRPAEQVRSVLVSAALQVFLETSLTEEGNDFIGLANAIHSKFGLDADPLELSKLNAGELDTRLREQVMTAYEARKRFLGPGPMLWTIRQILLQTIDLKWKDHLYNMDHLRGVIGFRGYGQKDPKVEYKREGYEMFDTMTRSIEDSVTDYLLKVEFNFGERDAPSVWHADSYIHEAAQAYQQQQEAASAPQGGEQAAPKAIVAGKEPGRNDPCPCGKTRAGGKPVKYKNCCGRRRTG